MGSFHVGGREVVGSPASRCCEVVFTPGGVPAGGRSQWPLSHGRADVRPVHDPPPAPWCAARPGAAADVAWRRPHRRHLGNHAGRPRGLASIPSSAAAGPVYVSDAVERGRSGWGMIPEQTGGTPVVLTMDNPWERFRIGDGPGSFARGTRRIPACNSRQPVSGRGLPQLHPAGRAALAHHRQP